MWKSEETVLCEIDFLHVHNEFTVTDSLFNGEPNNFCGKCSKIKVLSVEVHQINW